MVVIYTIFELFRSAEGNKEPRPQGGPLKPKFSKPKTEIPKSLDPELSSGPGSG
jgi:hypothetical protein